MGFCNILAPVAENPLIKPENDTSSVQVKQQIGWIWFYDSGF